LDDRASISNEQKRELVLGTLNNDEVKAEILSMHANLSRIVEINFVQAIERNQLLVRRLEEAGA
jgi:hypothetical protein